MRAVLISPAISIYSVFIRKGVLPHAGLSALPEAIHKPEGVVAMPPGHTFLDMFPDAFSTGRNTGGGGVVCA